MHALEWILCLTALMGALALLLNGMNTHQVKWNETETNWKQNQHELKCSSLWDRANSHFIVFSKTGCETFQFSLHADSGSLFLMGMDGNHYE